MRKKLAALLALCLSLSLTILPASAALSVDNARYLLQKHYVEQIPEEILQLDTLEEILDKLGDPYTTYMSAEQFQAMLDRINGSSHIGIGVELAPPDGTDGSMILSVMINSPAQRAGLKAGDRIVAVDGREVTEHTDMLSVLQGKEGTTVVVTVLHLGDDVREDYTLTRSPFTTPTVYGEKIGDAAYISCGSFGENTADEVQRVLEEQKDAASVLFDLRGNPGGVLDAVSNTMNLFTGKETAAYFRDSQGRYKSAKSTETFDEKCGKPLILTMDGSSASAAEIFAGAVRDYGLGISVGQRSFGKGVAQVVLNEDTDPEMFDGDNLKITKYQIYTPEGVTYHRIGIIPTLMISEENTTAAALLLTEAKPASEGLYLEISLLGHTYYIDTEEACGKLFRDAFKELMEALPPDIVLRMGNGNTWWDTDRNKVSDRFDLKCSFRTFDDVSDSPYRQEIDTLAVYQMVSGVGDGRFMPESKVTRAEFCAMVANAMNLPVPEDLKVFSDVPETAWYAECVAAAAKAGYVSGVGDGSFHPNDTISYQEMIAVMSNLATRVSIEMEMLNDQKVTAEENGRYHEFALWAHQAVRNLDKVHVLLDGAEPNRPATREMASALLCRVMETTGLLWTE